MKRKPYHLPKTKPLIDSMQKNLMAGLFPAKRKPEREIEIRRLIADYMAAEGCSCCQSIDRHREIKEKLALLLNVPKYSDGSGWNFGKFETKVKGKSK